MLAVEIEWVNLDIMLGSNLGSRKTTRQGWGQTFPAGRGLETASGAKTVIVHTHKCKNVFIIRTKKIKTKS